MNLLQNARLQAPSISPLKKFRSAPVTWLVGLAILSTSAGALAAVEPTHEPIKKAIQAGKLDEASKLAYLERQRGAKDPQLRFLEGVIHSQQGHKDRAIEIFRKLTEDYPKLPEPYNNLGVLLAAKGRPDEAKVAFEKALATHASYAAAQKNLSDIHAQLASKAYARALQVDEKLKPNGPALTLLGALEPVRTSPQETARPEPAKLASPEAKPAAPTASMAPSLNLPASAPVVAPVTAPASSAAKPEPAAVVAAPAKAATSERIGKPTQNPPAAVRNTKAIETAVQAWAQAWSSRDVNRYFASYSSGFDTPSKMSRKEWEAERRERIAARKFIRITVSGLKIEEKGSQAAVTFVQKYESDTVNVSSRKTLELVKQGDRWLIAREKAN